MNLFTDLYARVAALSELLGGVESVEQLPAAVVALDDATVFELIDVASRAGQLIEQISLVASGVMSTRSSRKAGHSGLAQSRGHRTAVALIQQVAGVSRSEAMRQVRVGGALIGADALGDGVIDGSSGAAVGAAVVGGVSVGADGDALGGDASKKVVNREPWHAPLREALLRGDLSAAQHDAIRQGLGEPPLARVGSAGGDGAGGVCAGGVGSTADPEIDGTLTDPAAAAAALDETRANIAAWKLAAERLTEDAACVTVEDLAKHARAVRDLLDPEGAQARFASRYEARSFRMWTDREGFTHGKFVFDDESAAWLRSIIDSALRPRRGGPRFVDPKEQAAAKLLRDDTRSNEQLAHDLLLDVWKAGAVADAATIFGARQAGIRLVQVVDRDDYYAGRAAPVTRLIDGGMTLPESMAAKQRCNTGVQLVVADRAGNPLDVGREQRLYTSKQRIALAVRDGGCRWNGCDRPASYCEAHHIDHWSADSGRTDVDRGILLCSFHHMQLHNNGWKITREGDGPFMLHPPPEPSDGEGQRVGRNVSAETGESVVPALPAPSVQPTPPTLPSFTSLHIKPHVGPIELRAPLPLRYGWQLAAPPEKRFRRAA